MKLPIGTKVDLFERDGYETIAGVVEGYEGDCIIIKYKNRKYKIPKPAIRVEIVTRGNSLKQYEV